MKDCNEMVFSKDHYDDEYEMWEDINNFIHTLLTNDYVCHVRCDEQGLGIYVVEYNPRDDNLTDYRSTWVKFEEVIRDDV